MKNMNKYNLWIRLLVVLLIIAVIGVYPVSVKSVLAAPVSNATIVNVTSYVNIRSRASNSGVATTTATLGNRVTFIEEVTHASDDTSGYDKWSKIQIVKGSTTYTGYVASIYVLRDSAYSTPIPHGDAAFEASISAFPESYKKYLRALHIEHPAWVFHAENVGDTWDNCLAKETADGVSLIQNTSDSAWISRVYDGVRDSPNWVNASSAIVAYYMDPRNMLNDAAVFQFVDLNYVDASISEDAIARVLNGTFMAQPNKATYVPGEVLNYFQLFAMAGNQASDDNTGINPIFLASHCVQEVSPNGSFSTRGSTGYYNFYNIGAYSSVTNAAANGLTLARTGLDSAFNARYHIPWNTPGLAIVYGGKWIYDNYTSKGQDTLYYMRFNVSPDRHYNLCKHQYMTAIQSLVTESQRMLLAYRASGIIDTELHFYIPVYADMPEEASKIPTSANQYVDFINLICDGMLSRDPSSNEIANWTNSLSSGNSGASVVSTIINSAEFVNKGYSNTEYLQRLYTTLFGRAARSSDLDYWGGLLDGGKSRIGVFTSLVNSVECSNYWRAYNVAIKPFSYSDNIDNNLNEFRPKVIDVYQTMLGRVPTGSEIRNGVSALLDPNSGVTILVAGIVRSNEFASRSSSTATVLNYLAQTLLGRDFTEAECSSYVDAIANGNSYEYVFSQVIGTNECHTYLNSRGFTNIPEYTSISNVGVNADIMPFIVNLYNGVFGRNPDTEGANYWLNRISEGRISGPQVAATFFLSTEFINAGLSNEEFITRLYQLCYNRAPDPSGFNYWLSRLNTYYSKEAVIAGFVNSPEYAAVCRSYNIGLACYAPSQTLEFKPDPEAVTGFVTRLYQMAFNREPDAGGLSYWSNNIITGSYNGYTISRYFIFSPEMESLGLSDEEFITRMYRIFLNRGPDATGFSYWCERMQNGLSRSGVFDGFAYSDEYTRLCLNSGIRPYTDFGV